MAAKLSYHQPIVQVKTTSGNDPSKLSIGEAQSQTFQMGVPVEVNGSGFIAEWDGTTIAAGIAGVGTASGSNLASNAKGAPAQPFGIVGPPGTSVTYGSVQNQSAAVNIPPGAPMSDGRQLLHLGVADTWFEAQLDDSSGNTSPVTAVTLVGKSYGMSKDTSGQWYVDVNKTGGSAVLMIKEVSPMDGLGVAFGRVWFTFLAASYQLG